MSAALKPDEIVRGMVALGVPREKAEAVAGVQPSANYVQAVGPMLAFPIRIRLPWSALVSDNRKYGVAMRGNGTNAHPKLLLTAEYRAAKESATKRAVDAMTVDGQRFEPFARPMALVARVWVPDNRHGHDVANFAKCAHDAFERIVYAKDEWLHDVRWIRAGVDVDAPRCEIEIAPL